MHAQLFVCLIVCARAYVRVRLCLVGSVGVVCACVRVCVRGCVGGVHVVRVCVVCE